MEVSRIEASHIASRCSLLISMNLLHAKEPFKFIFEHLNLNADPLLGIFCAIYYKYYSFMFVLQRWLQETPQLVYTKIYGFLQVPWFLKGIQ